MKILLTQERTVEVEIDPQAFINEFRQEADDYFEDPARFADGKALEEFIVESVHIMGVDDFLYNGATWIIGKTDDDTDLSVDIRKKSVGPILWKSQRLDEPS